MGGKRKRKEVVEKKEVKKDAGKEIDDLFSTLKSKKQEKQRKEEEVEKSKKKQKREKEKLKERIKELEAQNTNSTAMQDMNPNPKPVRYDEDGLPIYTEDGLQINKGGDTKDCPFDCWCCF